MWSFLWLKKLLPSKIDTGGCFEVKIGLFRFSAGKNCPKLPVLGLNFIWTCSTICWREATSENHIQTIPNLWQTLHSWVCWIRTFLCFVFFVTPALICLFIQSERRRGVRDFVQARILDKTICFCVKTVQIQDFCGESDQSKLRATRFSGLVCLLCFIVINHRHLPISRRSLKLNTEDLLSKIVYQPSPKKRKKFPAL